MVSCRTIRTQYTLGKCRSFLNVKVCLRSVFSNAIILSSIGPRRSKKWFQHTNSLRNPDKRTSLFQLVDRLSYEMHKIRITETDLKWPNIVSMSFPCQFSRAIWSLSFFGILHHVSHSKLMRFITNKTSEKQMAVCPQANSIFARNIVWSKRLELNCVQNQSMNFKLFEDPSSVEDSMLQVWRAKAPSATQIRIRWSS